MEVSEFEALRQHLMSVAYRLTGTVADAEDIVQEAWLRWDSQDTVIADPRAWLTTVVSRLGLDKLRSAAHRRETYTGTWLPEPVVTGLDATDPLAAVVAAEDARFAAMVVLERLRPDQRVAFVLKTGRRAVPKWPRCWEPARPPRASWRAGPQGRHGAARPDIGGSGSGPQRGGRPADGRHGQLVPGHGGVALHPDVTFTGDSNGKAPTAVRAVRGSDKVVRFILGLVQRYGPGLFGANQLALVNGELGAYTAGLPGVDGYRAMAPRITAITVRDGKVCALWDIANPDKFTGSPLKERRAQPTGRGRHHRN
ncbi:RNA polymerase sigma factor SigJ [Mycobacterium tuberculosis CAS/NITR204]|uniref:RNA polymerase sigma factor SigJ n=1 Tax=Mycobacterium tuberculosis CAS/NITR204 TaxID=1310114 RepID=R4MLE2_MYCTX|nr:RNA polymerase sigma factor SigJ [Mycobacterium tuberculosis CAS/NITR204]